MYTQKLYVYTVDKMFRRALISTVFIQSDKRLGFIATKQKRKEVNLTQEEFAERLGVALTVVRKIEQGKTNMQLDKVNLILNMFGHTLAPVPQKDIE